jgi:large subunit ribosomal protein L24
MKIKKGDMVVVIAGEDRSAVPRVVQQVIDGGKKVVIEGVNLVYKHVKRGHPKSPQGGRLRMEKGISATNVMFFCPSCNRGVRLGLRYRPDGSKERFCRKCSKTVGQVSPPRPAHAAN